MAASTLFFNGILTSIPGAYSKVNAAGLESVGLGASGIVAVLGTCQGGKPVSAMASAAELERITRPGKEDDLFRSGDLYEAIPILFNPSNDEQIEAGAQVVIPVKVNPATQSEATFANGQGDAITLTSKDYGAHTEQINVSIAAGTIQGKLLTITFEDVVEAVDDLGGDNILTLTYVTHTDSWGKGAGAVLTAQLLAGGDIQALATRTSVGIDGDITDGLVGVMSVVSDSASDVQEITIYGHDASDLPVSETLTLTGVTPVTGTQAFKAASVWGARLSVAAAGSITVSDTNPTVLITLTVGEFSQGMLLGVAMFVSGGIVSMVSSGASVKEVILAGKSVTGATQLERRTLTGTTPTIGQTLSGTWTWDGSTTVLATATAQVVAGNWISLDADGQAFKVVSVVANTSVVIENPRGLTIPSGAGGSSFALGWSEITGIVLGDVEAAQTITFSAEIGWASKTVQTTIQKVEDYFDARSVTISSVTYGFICAQISGETEFAVSDLDVMSAVTNILDTLYGFKADLYAMVAWINANSGYVTAAAVSGAKDGFPTNTTAPVFLSGGGEGTVTQAQWQTGLNLLRTLRVNTIVPLTSDPAVHAALDAHNAYMAGAGRNERDGIVGIQNSGQTAVPTKTEIKSQIQALNTRHIRVVAETMDRFNKAGVRTTLQPQFTALVAAGMQAGSSVGTSLTSKYANVLDVGRDSSWNPTDDADEMIQAGLLFLERREDVGFRWVRNVTTYLKSANLAFVEGSVNEAANYSAYNFRTAMEYAVGRKGFGGTVRAAEGVAIGILDGLIGEEVLTDYQSLSFDLTLDVMEVAVEMAPVIPINFVPCTIHLVVTG